MFRLFKKFSGLDWILTAFMVGAIVAQIYFDVTIPDYSTKVMNTLNNGGDAWEAGLPMIWYSFASMGCTLVASYFAATVAANLSARLRGQVFAKVQSFGFSEHNKFSTPSLITRSTGDIVQVQDSMIMLLRFGVSAPLNTIWAIIKINAKSAELTIASGIWIAFMLVTIAILIMLIMPRFGKIQKLTDKINQKARQNLTGLRVVKAYNADKYEEKQFDEVVTTASKFDTFVGRIGGMFFPLIFLCLNGIILTIYYVGGSLINNETLNVILGINPPDTVTTEISGGLDVGTMVAFQQLAMQVLFSFMMLIMVFVMVPRAVVSAKRINEVYDTVPAISDPSNPVEFTPSAEIEFKNVSFKYDGADEYVLKDISFKANAGETVAFIGSTGSGKSTIINLVPRFYDVNEGEVLVGGVNVKNVRQAELLKSIGYVPQKGVLFSGTVADNIGFGLTPQEIEELVKDPNKKDPNAEQEFATTGVMPVRNLAYQFSGIERVALVANADGFIKQMDGGYNANIAQGGKNVSGGQRQRISIARAVALDPKIFIFDDSFSALDYKTDKAVRSALKNRGTGATNLIVAQRVGSIMDADRIIVLEKGEMVGMGKHSELIKSCEVYREIALSQLSASELGIA